MGRAGFRHGRWLVSPKGQPPGGDGEQRLRFITGSVVPPFAVGGKRFGELVSGGSPNPSLQALAVALLDAQIEGGFLLKFE